MNGPHTGACLCGAVRLEAATLEGPFVHCHCRSCRKSSGSAFGANIAAPLSGFKVTSGEALLSKYESSPGKVRHFCSRCGSPLFTLVGANPSHARLRLGCLDSQVMETCAANIFLEDGAEWYEPSPSVPAFATWPDPDTVNIPGSHQPTYR